MIIEIKLILAIALVVALLKAIAKVFLHFSLSPLRARKNNNYCYLYSSAYFRDIIMIIETKLILAIALVVALSRAFKGDSNKFPFTFCYRL